MASCSARSRRVGNERAGGRLCFPRSMIEDFIDGAATSFVFHGRDPKHDIEIGGDRVYFGTGGAAVQTLDLETGLYRPPPSADLYDFTRLADTLTNVSWFTRCCVATDLEDVRDLDINTVYALLAGTTKPSAPASPSRSMSIRSSTCSIWRSGVRGGFANGRFARRISAR